MYSIKDESEHHYEIQTPEGSSFHVAKVGLSPQMHENLRKLCMGGYSEGGQVNYGVSKENTLDAKKAADIRNAFGGAPAQPIKKYDGGGEVDVPDEEVSALPEEGPGMVPVGVGAEGALQQASVDGVAAPQQEPIPASPTSPEVAGQYNQALETERGALKQQEQATSKLGQAQAAVLGEQVTNAKQEQEKHVNREIQRMGQQQLLARDIAASKIDPNAYFNNLSVPGKISTVIGLLLGGIGAGATGGVNQAVSVLNHQINTDVEAQKANLENKQSLYSKNLQASQDERQATLLTQSQQLSIAQAKLAQEAAKNQTPQAQAAFQMASAQIDKQQAAISQQLFLAQLQNKIATGGKFDARLAPFSKQPAAVVSMGDGTAIQASSPQAAGKVQEVLATHDPAINTLNKLEELSVNPIRPNSPEYQTAQSLVGTLLTQLKNTSGLGRISPEAMKLLESTFNDPRHLHDLLTKDERTKALKQSLIEQRDAKIAPYLPSYKSRTKLGFKHSK